MPNLTKENRDAIIELLWVARDEAFWAEEAQGISDHAEEKIIIDRAIDAIKGISERLGNL